MAALTILAAELLALYIFGSYALGRLGGLGASRGLPGLFFFYLAVLPGVALHETAHYLACKATLTPVKRFVPFSPTRLGNGGIRLGYVEFARPNPIVKAAIGAAPMVVNPLALLMITGLLTPLELAWILSDSTAVGDVLRDAAGDLAGFAVASPLLFALWAYLASSFALGSALSSEDLSALPVAGFLVGAGVLGGSLLWGVDPTSALAPIASAAAALYVLPVAVCAVAAGACALLIR